MMKKRIVHMLLSSLCLAFVCLFPQGAQAAYDWMSSTGGNWSVSGNWTNGIVPNGAGISANIKANIASDQTVVLDTNITLGALTIGTTNKSGGYTLAGNGSSTLTFDNGGGAATLTEATSGKGNTISANLLLAANLTVTVPVAPTGSSNILVLSGSIGDGGNGVSLTKPGAGWLNLFGTNSYSGGTILSQGRLGINSDRSLGAVPASPAVNLASESSRWFWFMAYDNITLHTNRNIQFKEKGGMAVKEGKTLTINGQISGYGPTLNPNFGPDSVWTDDPEATVWHGNFVFAPGNTYVQSPAPVDNKTVLCYGRLFISADSCLGAVPASFYYRDVILATGDYGNPVNNAILSATETFALHANRGVSLQSPRNAIEVAAGKTFTIQGPVLGDPTKSMASLSKLGDGTLVLNGLNTYTGNTIVVAGTLLINNSLPAGAASTVSVSNGAILGGTGTISNPVTVASGGTLAPGVSAGTLTVNSTVTLNAGSTLSVDVGASSDLLDLAGGGALELVSSPALSVVDTAPIIVGTVITIVANATAVNGQFNGLAEGATLDMAYNRYKIHYGATFVSLEVVPAGSTSYTLTGSVIGGNGTVSPTNALVLAGGSTNFVVTASAYYRISSLTTNGTLVGGMSFDNASTTTNFIWSNVLANGALVATFTAQVANDPANTPYAWLAQYGLPTSDAGAQGDTDGDRMLAWQEYVAGTIPTNRTSCLRVTEIPRNVINWAPVPGRVYLVYWSTNLLSGFQCVQSNIPYTQSSYTNVTTAPVNYYKVGVQLP